ncbi:MAG: glycosyl transferase, group 1 [Deinococcus sp.]|nr:glycosyl transferase, group 1 [Deinococcus sp.]
MKVLVAHNFYQQAGGEDEVFRAETQQLERLGVEVSRYTVHNDDLKGGSAARAALQTIWNPASARALAGIVKEQGIDVVHFHNTFPIISPAAYWGVKASGAAVVQTLHNYRLLCVAHNFYRDGRPCQDCLGKTPPWPAVKHSCYRESRAASGVAAGMLTTHRMLGTYRRMVDVYISLTEFARGLYVQGGLPESRLVVKPNFLADDPGVGAHGGGYALFVGRLSPEKGVLTLLEAWKTLHTRLPLVIVGDGPLAAEAEAAAAAYAGVTYLGRQEKAQVSRLMQDATTLIFPSQWYEGFPMTLLEAFATGLPVVASRIGSVAEVVEHDRTGRHFRPGDPQDLAAQVGWLLDHPEARTEMGRTARQTYQDHYTAERNGQLLQDIYRRAQWQARAGSKTVQPSTGD